MKKGKKKVYGILSPYGHLMFDAYNKKEAEKQFSKDFNIIKYPVVLLKNNI